MQRAAARRSASACHKVIAPCSTNFDNNPIRIALCPIDACRIRRQNAGSLANLRFGVKHEKQEVSLNIHNLANAKPNLGDIGYVDEEGYLYLTDRKFFMIISGGVNIYPQESENVLVTHPLVADVAVFGIPDEEMGESVHAVVQPLAGTEPSPALAAELIEYCRERLAHYKCPRSVDFRTELPRSEAGKLYKGLLKAAYWKDRALTS